MSTLNKITISILLAALPLLKISAAPIKSYAPEVREELAYNLGVQAFIYSYPLVHVNNFRYKYWSPESPDYSRPINRLIHDRELSSGKDSTAASPNNDTLYSMTFVNLSTQPALISTPHMGERYYTIQLADSYATNFGAIGTRFNKGAKGKYMIVGPSWTGPKPEGVDQVLRSPTPWAIVLLRILADNREDLGVVHKLQDQFKLTSVDGSELSPGTASDVPSIANGSDTMAIWSIINRELTQNAPAPEDKSLLEQFATVGIGPGLSQDFSAMDEDVKKGLIRAAQSGMEIVNASADSIAGGNHFNGWDYPQADIGRYGTDYLYRAGVTRMGLIANDPEESTYLSVYSDNEGASLSGSQSYRIDFSQEQLPPADAFWSITVYDRQTYKLVDNVLDRYSIGDRTEGLSYREDGGLQINLSLKKPESGSDNWLPIPEGEFYLIMRVYLPKQSVVSQTWQPPALEKL